MNFPLSLFVRLGWNKFLSHDNLRHVVHDAWCVFQDIYLKLYRECDTQNTLHYNWLLYFFLCMSFLKSLLFSFDARTHKIKQSNPFHNFFRKRSFWCLIERAIPWEDFVMIIFIFFYMKIHCKEKTPFRKVEKKKSFNLFMDQQYYAGDIINFIIVCLLFFVETELETKGLFIGFLSYFFYSMRASVWLT